MGCTGVATCIYSHRTEAQWDADLDFTHSQRSKQFQLWDLWSGSSTRNWNISGGRAVIIKQKNVLLHLVGGGSHWSRMICHVAHGDG